MHTTTRTDDGREVVRVDTRTMTAEDYESWAKGRLERAMEALADVRVPSGTHDDYWDADKALGRVIEQLHSAQLWIDKAYRLRFPLAEPEVDA